MNYDNIDKKIEFLNKIEKFKIINRKIKKIDLNSETNSDHSWHLAMYILIFKDELKELNLDYTKMLEIALIHDLPEIYTGDIFSFDKKGKEKEIKENEFKAAEKLFSFLNEKEKSRLLNLFEEYENKKTKESCIVNAFDKIQPDNLNISTRGQNWKEMKITKKMLIDYKKEITSTSSLTNYLFEKNIEIGEKNGWLK